MKMKNESILHQKLVELVHDLLPEDQAAELRARMDSEPEIDTLYRQIMQKASVIAEAAKLETGKSLFVENSPFLLSVPGTRKSTDDVDSGEVCVSGNRVSGNKANRQTDAILQTVTEQGVTQIVHASHLKKHALRVFSWEFAKRAIQQERGINRVMTWSAVCLVVLTFFGFLYQRYQIREVADIPVRVCATVPETLVEGTGQTIQLQVSDLLGNTKQTPVRMSLMSQAGDLLAEQTIPTDESGRLSFPVASLLDSIQLDSSRQVLKKSLDNQIVQLEISADKPFAEKQVARLRVVKPAAKTAFDYHSMIADINRSMISRQPVMIAMTQPASPQMSSPARSWMSDGTASVSAGSGMGMSGEAGSGSGMGGLMSIPAQTPYQSHPSQLQLQALDSQRDGMSFGNLHNRTRRYSLPLNDRKESFDSEGNPIVRIFNSNDKTINEEIVVAENTKEVATLPSVSPSSPVAVSPPVMRETVSLPVSGMDKNNDVDTKLADEKSAPAESPVSMTADSLDKIPDDVVPNVETPEGPATKQSDSAVTQVVPLEITLFPEGGRLAVSLENRVFFKGMNGDQTNGDAGNNSGEPLSGKLVDDMDHTILSVRPTFDGYGEFRFVPQPHRKYRLVVERKEPLEQENLIPQPVWGAAFGLAQLPCVAGLPYPASGTSHRFEYNAPSCEFDLGEADVDLPITMSLAKHVIEADNTETGNTETGNTETGNTETGNDNSESVTVHLRSNMEHWPLVVSVSKDGILLCAEPVVTDSKMTTVTLPLDKSVLGLLDVSVFDARNESLQSLTHEKILRRPKQWATVKASYQTSPLQASDESPHERTKYHLDLQIVDSQGVSIPDSDVSVHVVRVDLSLDMKRDSQKESFVRYLSTTTMQKLLGTQFETSSVATEAGRMGAETIDWATLESLISSSDSESQAKLDLLLATYRPKTRHKTVVVELPPGLAGNNVSVGNNLPAARPPLIFDNYSELKRLYQHKIDVFRNKRQSWERIVGIIGIFGGMSLALLSMMLVVMRLVSGMRMAMIVVFSGLSCILICMMMLQGQTVSKPFPMKDLSFAAVSAHNDVQPLSKVKSLSETPILPETTSSTVPSDIGMYSVSNSIAERQGHEPEWNGADSSQQETSRYLTMVYENEHLKTDSRGKVSVDFSSPQNGKSILYLIVDAVTPTGIPSVLRLPLK